MKTLQKKCPNKQKHKKTKKRNYKKGGTSLRYTPVVPTMQDKIDEFINAVELNRDPGTNTRPARTFGHITTHLETIQPLQDFTADDIKKIHSTAEIRYDYLSSEIEQLITRRNNLGMFLPRLHEFINDFERQGQMPQHIGFPGLTIPPRF
jgi:hypothetical protein